MNNTESFKKWVLKTYKYSWLTLSDAILIDALNDYNREYKVNITKFWD